ncbi:MAG: phosphatidylglycerophosphatase A [Gemmatimonadota bacterium]
MTRAAVWGATLGPIGYWPWGPGTLASAAVTLVWWATAPGVAVTIVAAVLLGGLGVPLAGSAERALGPDDRRIVVDEAAGMALALAGAPPGVAGALVALAWFRLFDIFKPPPVRQAERVAGGVGVMLDDMVAGALAAAATAGTLWLWRYAG